MTAASDQDRCDQMELVSAYVLKALPPGEASAMQAHIVVCEMCRQELQTLQPLIGSFAAWPIEILRPSASIWDRLLERIEHSAQARDPAAYRLLVQRIQSVLAEELPDDGRRAVLAAFPATAEIHENLHYAQAGLSRAPLDLSVTTKMRAAALLKRISKAAPAADAGG